MLETPLTTCPHQLELEHRISKARFLRTSGRSIPLNLSKIERRERHIRRIREKIRPTVAQPALALEDLVHNPRAQYNIGKSQNWPVHIPSFLQKNDGDPATKVSTHLLEIISTRSVSSESGLLYQTQGSLTSSDSRDPDTRGCILPRAFQRNGFPREGLLGGNPCFQH